MAERHRLCTAGERRQPDERAFQQRTVRFDHAVDARKASAPQKCNRHDKAEECGWARPEVAENAGHKSIMKEARGADKTDG